jgi:hypothetical protein
MGVPNTNSHPLSIFTSQVCFQIHMQMYLKLCIAIVPKEPMTLVIQQKVGAP